MEMLDQLDVGTETLTGSGREIFILRFAVD